MTTKADNHDHADQGVRESEHAEKPGYDDLNTPVILLVGVISAIVTFLTIAFVQGLCYQWQGSYIRARQTDFPNTPINELIEKQQKMLTGDQPGTISIENSMKNIVAEYNQKPIDASGKSH